MRPAIKDMMNVILNARFSFLFFTVVLLFLLRPFLEGLMALKFVTDIFLWFLIISCVWAVHEKRKRQWLVIVMAAVAILETLTGQLFIAITVARLVSLYTVAGNKREVD